MSFSVTCVIFHSFYLYLSITQLHQRTSAPNLLFFLTASVSLGHFLHLYTASVRSSCSLSLLWYSISSWTAVSQGESGQTNWTSVSRWDLISLRSHRCPLRCPCFTQMWLNSLKHTHRPVRTQPIPLTPSAEPQHHLWRTQSSIQSNVLMTHHQSHDAFFLGKRSFRNI